jgi:hypothetical protein
VTVERDEAHVAAACWDPAHAAVLRSRIVAGRIPMHPPDVLAATVTAADADARSAIALPRPRRRSRP